MSLLRYCEPHQMLLSFCTEDGSMSAPPGDHHIPSRDLSLHAQAADGAPCGEQKAGIYFGDNLGQGKRNNKHKLQNWRGKPENQLSS